LSLQWNIRFVCLLRREICLVIKNSFNIFRSLDWVCVNYFRNFIEYAILYRISILVLRNVIRNLITSIAEIGLIISCLIPSLLILLLSNFNLLLLLSIWNVLKILIWEMIIGRFVGSRSVEVLLLLCLWLLLLMLFDL